MFNLIFFSLFRLLLFWHGCSSSTMLRLAIYLPLSLSHSLLYPFFSAEHIHFVNWATKAFEWVFAQTTSTIKNYVVQENYMFGKQEDRRHRRFVAGIVIIDGVARKKGRCAHIALLFVVSHHCANFRMNSFSFCFNRFDLLSAIVDSHAGWHCCVNSSEEKYIYILPLN